MGKMACRIYFAVFLAICANGPSAGQSISPTKEITAVSGESWLVHLHRTFDETSMGKTGRLGGPELVQQTASALPVRDTSGGVLLSGADLYRLNCRGCHGEFGTGAPPEINSVINPVRATSVAAVMARMKNAGAEISRADAIKLAEQSKAMLLQRLHNGGQDMPAFPQLSAVDIKVLTSYLKQMAEVPGAEQEHGRVRVSPLRVGELIVKSTCHTCHSATGENPTPRELSDGAIPPLSALTSRVNRIEFIGKVTIGAPVLMGEPPLLYRGRMPVFYYLSQEEAADIYQYLLTYPPTQAEGADSAMALSQSRNIGEDSPPNSNTLPSSGAPTFAKGNSSLDNRAVLSIVGALTMLLLGAGAALTVYEMRKLTVRICSEQNVHASDHWHNLEKHPVTVLKKTKDEEIACLSR
jgi:mono/diheme cytochrome c family protein